MLLRELIIDACALINLILGEAAEECLCSVDPKVQVTPAIAKECHGRTHTAEALRALLSSDLLEPCDVEITSDALIDFMAAHGLGAGESEAILACAQVERYLWSDDRRARRVAAETLGEDRVTGTIGVLQSLCILGDLGPEAAYTAYCAMRAAGSFLPAMELADFPAGEGQC